MKQKLFALYIFYSLLALSAAGFLVYSIKSQLIPGSTQLDDNFYEQIFTLFGVIFMFLFVLPAIPTLLKDLFMSIKRKLINNEDFTKNKKIKLDKKIKRNL